MSETQTNNTNSSGNAADNTTLIIVVVVVVVILFLCIAVCLILFILKQRGYKLPCFKGKGADYIEPTLTVSQRDNASTDGSLCPSVSLDVGSPTPSNPLVYNKNRNSVQTNHFPGDDRRQNSYIELNARQLSHEAYVNGGVQSKGIILSSTESIYDDGRIIPEDGVVYRSSNRQPIRHESLESSPGLGTKSRSLDNSYHDGNRAPEHRSTYHEDMGMRRYEAYIPQRNPNSLPSNSISAKRYLHNKALSQDSGIGNSSISLRQSASSLERDGISYRNSTLSTDSVFSDVDSSTGSLSKVGHVTDSLAERKEMLRFHNKLQREFLPNDGSVALNSPYDRETMIKLLINQFRRLCNDSSYKDTIFVTPNFAIGLFDQNGGHLTLPDKSVDLYIPPGALNRCQEVYMCRCLDDYDNDDVIFYSPVVDCGPDGLRFITPVIMTFKHCASATINHNPHLSLARKHSDEEAWDSGFEDDAHLSIEDQKCTLLINHFTKFGVGLACKEGSGKGIVRERIGNNSFDSGYISPSVSKGDISESPFPGRSPPKGAAAAVGCEDQKQEVAYTKPSKHQLTPVIPDKWLYICCFLQYQGVNMSVIRIYFLNKEQGILNSLEAQEAMCDGKLGSPPQEMLFRPKEDLKVVIKSCDGCELLGDTKEQAFDVEDVLSKSFAYVNFPVRITTKDANAVCTMEVFQPSRAKQRVPFTAIMNSWDKRSLEVEDLMKRFTELVNPRSFPHDQVLNFLQDKSLLPASKHQSMISIELRKRLSLWLDVTNDMLSDWRGLAEELGMDSDQIIWLGNNPTVISKTDMALSVYENKCHTERKDPVTVLEGLMGALRKIGHDRGYQLVKRHIEEHGMDLNPQLQNHLVQADTGRHFMPPHHHDPRHVSSQGHNHVRHVPTAIPEECEPTSDYDTFPKSSGARPKKTSRQESGYGSMSENSNATFV